MSQRKINFFFLQLSENERIFEIEISVNRLLRYISSFSRTRRKQDLPNDRICFLESYSYDENTHIAKLLFKSAKHSYRAPLLNRNTVELRDNPKTMEEGEQVKTHLLVKFKEGDAIVFLETGRDILTMKSITDYLNLFVSIFNNNHNRDKINGSFRFDMIPRDDFGEVLDNMQRVTCASIYVQKQILGSEALNFSDTTHEAKEDIITLNPQLHSRSATYIKRNGLLIRKTAIKSLRPFQCAYYPLTPQSDLRQYAISGHQVM